MGRNEDILRSILGGQPYDKEPRSRMEKLLIEVGKQVGAGGGSGPQVVCLDESADFASGNVVDVLGVPSYVGESELDQHAAFGLTESGWYAFARISAPAGVTVASGFGITGAAGFIPPSVGDDHVDVAVRYGVTAESCRVTVNWGETSSSCVFRASDLAIRNLDSRATYYVYDMSEFATWSWALTTDATFVDGTHYYTKSGDDYTLAEVTVGEAVPAETYWVHTGVTFEGMPRNVSYTMALIDCPVTFVLPEVGEGNYGAWIEMQARFTKAVSVTLRVPEGVKMSGTGTQSITAGVNILTMQYFNAGRVWRLDNTKWADPS